jgi:hypothetical protein
VNQAGDIAERIEGERRHATDGLLQRSKPNQCAAIVDNLRAMPVSDEEIAAVEAFLGLQAAMILKEDKTNPGRAI